MFSLTNIFIAVFILGTLAIVTVPLGLGLSYRRAKEDDHFQLDFMVMGWSVFSLLIPTLDLVGPVISTRYQGQVAGEPVGTADERVTPDELAEQPAVGVNAVRATKTVLDFMRGLWNEDEGGEDGSRGTPVTLIPYIGARIIFNYAQECKNLQLVLRFGTGSAAATSLIMGSLWGIVGSAYAGVENRMKITGVPDISITPDFEREVFTVFLHCIFRFRLGHIILVSFRKTVRRWKAKGVRAYG